MYLPAPHASHEGCPFCAWNLPAAQGEHTPATRELPAGHVLHVAELVAPREEL
jgi:hypothetical protein